MMFSLSKPCTDRHASSPNYNNYRMKTVKILSVQNIFLVSFYIYFITPSLFLFLYLVLGMKLKTLAYQISTLPVGYISSPRVEHLPLRNFLYLCGRVFDVSQNLNQQLSIFLVGNCRNHSFFPTASLSLALLCHILFTCIKTSKNFEMKLQNNITYFD